MERVIAPLATVAAVALAALALVWLFQRRLIYFPDSRTPGDVRSAMPAAEQVRFETADGLLLAGWLVPAAGPANGYTAVVFNGNAGNRSNRAPLAGALARRGFAVLLFDYRGYGGNAGSPSEAGLLRDARAAVGYLTGERAVSPSRLVYFGESLGAAVALALALEQAPAALVLRSPFTSLTDMAKAHYPFLPGGPLLKDRYESIAKIGGVESPILIIAGERDTIVPASQSRSLYERAPEPKRLVIILGADHNDPELAWGDELIEAIVRFLAEEAEGRPG